MMESILLREKELREKFMQEAQLTRKETEKRVHKMATRAAQLKERWTALKSKICN